jgi:hypothetical protein
VAGSIHIVETPKGDAPRWVREQWVGLTLPLLHPHTIVEQATSVFRPPRPLSRLELLWRWITGRHPWRGYLVDVNTSLDILEGKSGEAAAWWRTNTPHLAGYVFMFDYGCCDPIDHKATGASGRNPANDA